jgi:hypothetical protein
MFLVIVVIGVMMIGPLLLEVLERKIGGSR